MCHYCGCRDMPLLRDYIAEHEQVTNLGGAAVRALDRDDLGRARELIASMSAQLRTHWQGEENGVFAAMRKDELFSQHIEPLVHEHRELAALLASVDVTDPDDRVRLREAVSELHEHIAKEEDGIFPASLTALDGDEWDTAMRAWQEAHPDQHLIADAHRQGSDGPVGGSDGHPPSR